jgi:hypothetical protein
MRGRRKRVEDRINERARVVGAGVGEVAELGAKARTKA